ncbi:hypothetical protein AGMMS49938_16520 [Fibrobacterales bacterium]|nr:hypothetical protein AGMMS49938_16520 [Fibrobacterales bacterium]
MSKFTIGQKVALKSNDRLGVILAVLSNDTETQYKVFIDEKEQNFYESQLQIVEQKQEYKIVSSALFNCHITALQIRNPSISNLYSLNSAKIDFIPYQLRPVLKFIKADRPRMLIADSVGVGKTIEAGLILQELKARKDISSVLIICPKPLVAERKWENEMKRFGEDFTDLNGETLRHAVKEADCDGEWSDRYAKIIIPYSLFSEDVVEKLESLNPAPHFDLVIVDEAHHIRNKNLRHRAVRCFCDNADAVVFLSATPIQNNDDDLYSLLSVLRPDIIFDRSSFGNMSEPNQYITKAVKEIRKANENWISSALEQLNKIRETSWGKNFIVNSPDFIEIKEKLQSGDIDNAEKVKLIGKIEQLNTFFSLINRTRRRDIGNFTIREPHTVNIPFTELQKKLYDEFLSIKKELYLEKHGKATTSDKFVLSMISRQIASSPFGLVPVIKGFLNNNCEEAGVDEWGDEDGEKIESSDSLKERIKSLINFAKEIENEQDNKLDALIKIIEEKQKLPNNKVMIFSTFRHTLCYLYEKLENNYRIGLMHGGTKDEERRQYRERFEKDKGQEDCIDIMLFSEIGCEGLDYQFCDTMINYDLPWNPMRIEQRIGRIDRNGQKSEKVLIYNLVTPETIDADIYEKCLTKIGIFENVIGDGEDILGKKVSKGIENIANNFDLDEAQRKEKLQQLADNEIREIQEIEKLEKEQVELFGIQLPKNEMQKEIDDASSFWLSPNAIYRMVKLYLQKIADKEQVELTNEENLLKKFDISQETKKRLLIDFNKLKREKSHIWRDWEKWLKGQNLWKGENERRYISVTFEQKISKDNENALLLSMLHPLVKQASFFFEHENKPSVVLSANTNELPVGKYHFAVYLWEYHGIKKEVELKIISSNNAVNEQLLNLLKTAKEGESEINYYNDFSDLENNHYKLWNEAKEKHLCKNNKRIDYKKESLTKSYEDKITRLNNIISQLTDEAVKKMRKGEIEKAKNEHERQISELESSREKADIYHEKVGSGILMVN